ncbi:hypothetical protein FP744_10007996 [Trichoderma asperellum]|nr:hypothetical protein LI328DRAFT_17626 [Trichoderma asperelloides]
MAPDNSRVKHIEESIMNRKRELKGLSGSFSSNIGQRISPSNQQDSASISQKKKNRSVKSIIAWLEEAIANNDTSRNSGDDVKSVRSAGTISSAGSNSSLLSRQTMPGAADVEEYSLTLLKYKQYYTDVPLGRCLDGQEQDNATSSSNVHIKNVSEEASLVQGSQDSTQEFDILSASDEQLSRLSRYIDSVLVDGEEPNSMTIGGHDGVCGPEEIHLHRRSPQEVLAF